MDIIDPETFEGRLKLALSTEGLVVSTLKIIPQSGVHAEIDGEKCFTNIGLWPNGLFDVDYIKLPSRETAFVHKEFNSEDEALKSFVDEVRCAISRANRVNR